MSLHKRSYSFGLILFMLCMILHADVSCVSWFNLVYVLHLSIVTFFIYKRWFQEININVSLLTLLIILYNIDNKIHDKVIIYIVIFLWIEFDLPFNFINQNINSK